MLERLEYIYAAAFILVNVRNIYSFVEHSLAVYFGAKIRGKLRVMKRNGFYLMMQNLI